MRRLWFGTGAVVGVTLISLSSASVQKNQVTDDTALYQGLSEIRAARERDLNFDGDIQNLARLEDQFREKDLPTRRRRLQAMRTSQQAARAARVKANKTVRN